MDLDVWEDKMGSDLSLDLRYFASKAVKRARDVSALNVDECIRRLEEEQGKIKMFRQELPLFTRHLSEVIDVMKAEAGKKTKSDHKTVMTIEEEGTPGDKSKWMSTAQLWTGNSNREDAESEKQDKGRSLPEETSSGDGAFLPFKVVGSSVPAHAPLCLKEDDKAMDAGMPDLSLLSSSMIKSAPAANTDATKEAARTVTMASSVPPLSLKSQPQQTAQQQQQQKVRKARRTWSPELHRQFIAALNKLGGPQFATPKHIRELMKVDGLTNDEVKSHLQKYRLHNRKASGSAVVSQPIVLVGGLWIPGEQSNSQSGSPQGPLHFSTPRIIVSSAATAKYEEEDGRSESYGWK
ncbi:hypothetical protein HU200_000438 [Digitaria exilis]|uniref:HTH myb-type domain-containing protein n=1 Tax=Digitaria exilis TaxID=1010633 RepID=A0A835FYW4_9POAL|nr:hypothetical protein HU200_000438 [Digitaria exilis]